ncbi:MAG TPA: transcriptional regulator [Acidobacteriaceae bacterium]|nr:transcriptional regulator [Acidobacteriaceae bacterium]
MPVSKYEAQLPFWKFVTLLNEKRSSKSSTNTMTPGIHAELWISWGSLLRSYAAAHGLNSRHFAVIEFGEDVIVVRAGAKWVRFTQDGMERSDGGSAGFALNEDGTVTLDGTIDEMDFAAERVTRELMLG